MFTVLRVIVVAGLAAVGLLTAVGLLAFWFTALDIVNNGLPFLVLGALVLLGLALATGRRMLVRVALALVATTLILLLTAIPGAAPGGASGSPRFLRVATFNLWGRNDHTGNIDHFIEQTDADVLVLEEARPHHEPFLHALSPIYPNRVGENGLVILSKYPIVSEGRIARAGQPAWMGVILRWVTLDVNGTKVDVAGAHLARPFYADFQEGDIAALTRFVQGHQGPLILAGDFNMAPWTWKLKSFTETTGLGRFNTIYPTWPMRWKSVPLLPVIPIDNVFASPHFTNIGTSVGPRLGSDHRPVIADIGLAQ